MKQFFEATTLLVAICISSLCTGCAHPIAAIKHPGSDKVVLMKSSSWYANVLLSADEQSRTLRYMSKDDVEDCYFISTYDFDGRLIAKAAFPKFSNWCWLDFWYGAAYGGAVSPDCASVAYLDIQNASETQDKDLCWFNARTRTRKVLVSNLASKGNYLACLSWVSDRELLVAVDDPYKPDARLLLIDIEKPALRFDLRCRHFRNGQFALSHSRRYLAYWEGLDRHASLGSFRICDLSGGNEIAVTEAGEPSVFGGPKWSPEDDALAYVMDNNLVRFSVASKQWQVLKSFGHGPIIALQDYQGKRLYYRAWPADTMRFYSFDITSQQESQILSPPARGIFDLLVCPDETMIYYRLGQESL